MSYFLYIASGLILVILQTTVIPRVPAMSGCFDLLLPWVIYIAAFRPVHETLPFVVFMGVLVDSLSGGPFGLYLTSYGWLFAAVRLTAAVIRAENPLLLVGIILLAVAGQNALFYSVLGSAADEASTADAVRVVMQQLGWVLLAGPAVALAMRRAHRMSSRRRIRRPGSLQPGVGT